MNINKQNNKIKIILVLLYVNILNIRSINASSDVKSYPALYKSSPFGIARSTLSSPTSASTTPRSLSSCDNQYLDFEYDEISTSRRGNNLNQLQQQKIQPVSSTALLKNLARGSFLRIASDLSGKELIAWYATRKYKNTCDSRHREYDRCNEIDYSR